MFAKEGFLFFFEKKNQKTFIPLASCLPGTLRSLRHEF